MNLSLVLQGIKKFLQGDSHLHFKRINELCETEFPNLPELSNLDKALVHLSKQGVLHLDEIFEFENFSLF